MKTNAIRASARVSGYVHYFVHEGLSDGCDRPKLFVIPIKIAEHSVRSRVFFVPDRRPVSLEHTSHRNRVIYLFAVFKEVGEYRSLSWERGLSGLKEGLGFGGRRHGVRAKS